MNLLRPLVTASTAISAIVLAIVPFAMAIDFGGVLWWTQYIAAIAITVAFGFALPSIATWSSYYRRRQLLVMVPLVLWLGYSAFQNIPLPPSLVSVLSPGSYEAYTQWLIPILPAQLLPQSFPISLAAGETSHAVALFAVVVVLAWTSLRVFNTRSRIIGLLSCIAISSAMIAALGILSHTIPGLPFFKQVGTPSSPSFATFVNRNNAALFLNFGLAASLGLLAWRLSALTGQEIDGDEFEYNELFALASDRDSAIGLVCCVLCVLGLLVCGSRAGLGTAILATTVSFGWLRRRKGLATIPVLIAIVTIAAALLIVPLKLNLESIKRLEVLSSDVKTIANDGRLSHWPEGWSTAMAHLPGGSGLSTYGYAYLPYQNDTPKDWFVHADNLWLELFVEQGIVGLGLALITMIALGWCLTSISVSHDALDHGIRITGWYCLTAVTFSQCFDFGLIIPANLFLFTILMGAIVSRSNEAEVLIPETPDPPSRIAKLRATEGVAKSSHLFAATIVCLTIVAAVIELPNLREDAAIATSLQTAHLRIAEGEGTQVNLRQIRQEIDQTPGKRVLASRMAMLGEIDHRLARLIEVDEARPKSIEQATEIYKLTSPQYRRLVGRKASGYIDGLPASLDSFEKNTIASEYRDAIELYQAALVQRPLDPEIRGRLVTLDFASSPIESDTAQPYTAESGGATKALLRQLGQLHLGHPSQLRDVAVLAAQSRYEDMAAEYWNRSLLHSPKRTAEVVEKIHKYNDVDLMDSLPKDPIAMRMATQTILTKKYTDLDRHLDTLISNLGCDQCNTVDEKAYCLWLAGLAHLQIGQLDDAVKRIGEAVKLTPSNATFRLKLIELLRTADDSQAALREARLGRQINPTDSRYDRVIKQMAAQDLAPDSKIAPDSKK